MLILICLLLSASNGVVLATEKKQKSILYDEQSVHKVEPITKHIGMVYSGMGPDYRWGFFLRVEEKKKTAEVSFAILRHNVLFCLMSKGFKSTKGR